jgi:uncharacterized membrane protein
MDNDTKAKLNKAHENIKNLTAGHSFESRQNPHIAEIQIILAEEQEKASLRMEQQTNQLIEQTKILISFVKSTEILTRRLVRLTWGLVVVSVALFVFAFWQTEILVKKDAGDITQSHNQATNHNNLNTNSK